MIDVISMLVNMTSSAGMVTRGSTVVFERMLARHDSTTGMVVAVW